MALASLSDGEGVATLEIGDEGEGEVGVAAGGVEEEGKGEGEVEGVEEVEEAEGVAVGVGVEGGVLPVYGQGGSVIAGGLGPAASSR